MGNPYTESYAPQMMADQNIQPFMQDTRAQQTLNQLMMQQQMQAMQPGTAPPSQGPMQLAQALRTFGKGRQTPQGQSLEPSSWDTLKNWWNSATAPTPYDIRP